MHKNKNVHILFACVKSENHRNGENPHSWELKNCSRYWYTQTNSAKAQ